LRLRRPLPRPVRSAPVVELVAPAPQRIRASLEVAPGAHFDQLISTGGLMPARLREMQVGAALARWPHNESDARRRPAAPRPASHVKLAMAYLREHPARLVSGTELAGLANVSLRALQDGFRRFVGTTIVGYQRQVRLESARQVLARGEGASVAEVALQHGFSN